MLPVVGPVNDVEPDVSAALRNVYFPAYLVVLILAVSRLETVMVMIARAPLSTLLVALTFVSVLWSIDPEVTERRAVAVGFTTLCGFALAARFDWPTLLEVLAAAFAATVVMSFLIVWLLPSYGRMTDVFPGAWRGVWGHKNLLGYYMSVAFVVFVAAAILRPARRRLWIGFGAAAVALVLFSTSMTSLVSCLIAAACVGLVWIARRGRVGALAAAYLAVAGVCAAALLLIADPGLPLRLVGKDETLTGRTQIWAAVARQIALRPVTGYGYGAVWDERSFWGPLPWISRQQGFVIHEAHNSWLGVWLELGYGGLALAVLLFVDVGARIVWGLRHRPSAYFTLPFSVIFCLHAFTESVILTQNDLIWLMFAAVAVKLASPEDLGETGWPRRAY